MTRFLFRYLGAFIGPLIAMICLTGGSAVRAEQAGLLKQGEQLVRQHCTRCHVVGDLNKYGGIGSTRLLGRLNLCRTGRTALRLSGPCCHTRLWFRLKGFHLNARKACWPPQNRLF